MLTGFVLSVAMSTVMVPPWEPTHDHSQPGHYTQPTLRRFERWPVDRDRREAWEAYNRELADLWREYREAGSTPEAFARYQRAAGAAKSQYIWNDPYLKPVLP